MHYRFFVTFNKDAAATSEEARGYVNEYLTEEGFCAPQGRWSTALADWFVIGGRWSGELSRYSWGRTLYERMEKAEKAAGVHVWGASYADKKLQRKQKAMEKLFTMAWKKDAPKEYHHIPINRGSYLELGYEDDAMILTQELYDALLKEHEGSEDSEHHADLDYDLVSPKMVGKKWLVVVDYHN